MDQVITVGASSSTYAKTVEGLEYSREYMKAGHNTGGGHFFGFATCHWIKSCDESSGDRLGTPCEATLSGVLYKGYCFRSLYEKLECGHLTAIDNEYGEKPVSFDAFSKPGLTASSTSGATAIPVTPNVLPSSLGLVPSDTAAMLTIKPSTPGASQTVYRCPTGSPAKSLGTFVSKRFLIGGCMNSMDANYDSLAEVHVPPYCAVAADFHVGCMVPWATNFDAAAKQSGECKFPTAGCMSSTAVNYNSMATTDDGLCIEAVVGCTVNSTSYEGVAPDTPGYKSLWHGWYGNMDGSGRVDWSVYQGPTVKKFDPAANVNEGCIVAIEGCMTPGSVNYDPDATVSSMTWCIPEVKGCMMPHESNANVGYVNPGPVSSTYGKIDGLNADFSIMTTKHDRTMCVTARYGCSKKKKDVPGYGLVEAKNADKFGTVDSLCYYPKSGCLNPNAVNFGCTSAEAKETCNDLVNEHTASLCKFPQEDRTSPPTPPPPQFPNNWNPDDPNLKVEYGPSVESVIAGDMDYWEPRKPLLAQIFKKALSVPDSFNETSVVLTPGSVRAKVTFWTNDAAAANQLTADLEAKATSASEFGGLLNAAAAELGSDVEFTVLSKPSVFAETRVTVLHTPLTVGAITGITIGVLAGVIIIVAFIVYYRKKKAASKATYPA